MNSTDTALLNSNLAAPTTSFSYNTEAPPTIMQKKLELLPLFNDKNPLLSKRMSPIDLKNCPADIVDVAERMVFTMNHFGGAGLAANQCGIPYRLFVMSGGIVCINPVVLEFSDELDRSKEGCLTFPGLILPVSRSKNVKVEFYNLKGELESHVYSGATARVFQHETEHLDGKVFTSKVGSVTLQMARKKRQKLFKKITRIVEMKQARGLK